MSKKKAVMYRVSKPKDAPVRTVSTSKVLEAAWDAVRSSHPAWLEAHPDDVENIRRGFYAGAFTVLNTLINTDCLDEGKKTATKQDRDRVGAMWWEVCDFLNGLANGKGQHAEAGAAPTVQ